MDSELQNWKTDSEFAGMCNGSQGKAIVKAHRPGGAVTEWFSNMAAQQKEPPAELGPNPRHSNLIGLESGLDIGICKFSRWLRGAAGKVGTGSVSAQHWASLLFSWHFLPQLWVILQAPSSHLSHGDAWPLLGLNDPEVWKCRCPSWADGGPSLLCDAAGKWHHR